MGEEGIVEPQAVRDYYMRDDVKREIVEYSKGRWVALEAPSGGERLFIRYDRGVPLSIGSESDYISLFNRFSRFSFRTIYATANVYRRLAADGLRDESNVFRVTPVFDIDASLEDWRITLKAAEEIVGALERHGVIKSVYLKWSGRGVHVHINENAFSEEVLQRYGPVKVARAVVDLIISEVSEKVGQLSRSAKNAERELRVENRMDIQRLFTVPLSLHRFLNLSCVVFKPNEISSFDIQWADPESFRHSPYWREFERGEADELAELAVKSTPSGTQSPQSAVRTRPQRAAVGAGRFQVMGLLQAARYYLLKGDLNRAKSFGLNRAIFYAWAKYYGPARKGGSRTPVSEQGKEGQRKEVFERVGNEEAPVDTSTGLFRIGDRVQTPSDYDREIAMKISSIVSYDRAWNEALEYLRKFPREYLEDQRLFFERVYRPVRDTFLQTLLNGGIKEKERKI
ncbi:MAG: hypothetical protein ACP5GH_02935 [Nitrososphaeria archaeon]